jgi:hypothetical protein
MLIACNTFLIYSSDYWIMRPITGTTMTVLPLNLELDYTLVLSWSDDRGGQVKNRGQVLR